MKTYSVNTLQSTKEQKLKVMVSQTPRTRAGDIIEKYAC